MQTPTQEYITYTQAYAFFNVELFSGLLPPCLLTLQRKRSAYGYYSAKRFVSRNSGQERTDEIALNPDTFAGRIDKKILSTLVHEMVHLWQAHFGKPGRGRYHNREWANKMLMLGLQPISFDRPGRMTGQAVSHEITPGGRFDIAAEQLLSTGFRLTWQSTVYNVNARIKVGHEEQQAGESDGVNVVIQPLPSKVKYTCPMCKLNAWAKPKAALVCGGCTQVMQATM